jgi:hypothetical protein
MYIELERPIVVQPSLHVTSDDPDANPERNVRRVRLWCFNDEGCEEAALKRLKRCSITVLGKLHHGVAPLDFLDVTMDVTEFHAVHCAK